MIVIHNAIKDIPLTERPRERLKNVGGENLSDKELLAVILKNGTKELNVIDLALEILKKYSLKDLENISFKELMSIKGIGEVKSLELLAAIELGKRIFLSPAIPLLKLDSPEKIWHSSRYLFQNKKQELFYCFYLNNKQELLERKLLFMGTINQSTTHPREIFKEAYRLSASSIICLHNHPSNDLTPSKADLIFTEKLVRIGTLQGIPITDHIIVGDNAYYSFYEHHNILNL